MSQRVAEPTAVAYPTPGADSGSNEASEPDYLTVEQAAPRLQLNPKTLYAACKAGEVPGALKLGHVWRINRRALLSWTGLSGPALTEKHP
jgi:excisionase family DNA binding protein